MARELAGDKSASVWCYFCGKFPRSSDTNSIIVLFVVDAALDKLLLAIALIVALFLGILRKTLLYLPDLKRHSHTYTDKT